MNEKLWFSFKINVYAFIVITFTAFILGGATGGLCSYVYSKNRADNIGIGDYEQRERELLERIGDYERREKARIERENSRIRAEGERIRRTEALLGTLGELDRRSGDLLQELTKEINILADFFFSVRREHLDAVNNVDCEIDE